MDLTLIIFIAVTIFFAYRGYKNGLLRSLSRILGLLAGYTAAILYTKPVSVWIEDESSLQGIAALAVASISLFIIAGILVSIVFWLIKRFLPTREQATAISSMAGAGVGLVVGVLVAILVVWTFSFVRDMQPDADTQTVDKQNNKIEHMAQQAIGKAVSKVMALSDAQSEMAKLSAALIESPANITRQVQRFSSSSDLQTLLQDPQNQSVLNSGDIEAVQKLPAFQQLIKNPDLMALAKSAGMKDELSQNPKATEVALAGKMTDIWQRVQKVQNDQRVQDIFNNPEFQRKIQSTNPLDLLTNTQLLELADIIFSDKVEPAVQSNEVTTSSPKKEVVIHSWTDSNGRIHFSDKGKKP